MYGLQTEQARPYKIQFGIGVPTSALTPYSMLDFLAGKKRCDFKIECKKIKISITKKPFHQDESIIWDPNTGHIEYSNGPK